jgi:hypothetical protein
LCRQKKTYVASEKPIGEERRYGSGNGMKCPNCGAENSDISTYCQNCANPLEPIQKAPGERRKEKRKSVFRSSTVVNAIFMVAVIALAGISVSLLTLANDYHDAKYRAQYVLVNSLVESMNTAKPSISGMIDSTYPNSSRLAQSEYADATLKDASACASAISVMYPDGGKESDAFKSVYRAIAQTERVVYSYSVNLYARVVYNNNYYESNSTVNSLYLNVTEQMTVLTDHLFAGVDSSRDWQSSPYSLVKRMDLDAIEQASSQLEETGIQLLSLVP